MATETTALTHAPAAAPARISHLDLMPVLDIALSQQRRAFMKDVMEKVFTEDVDYGTIPGSAKPCLYKAGAERLTSMFGLSPTFEEVRVVEDWTGKDHGGEPLFAYTYRCRLTRNGYQIGEGIGSCNTWESKYRYRWVPEHEVPVHLDKSKLKKQGGMVAEPEFAIDKAETTGKYGKPAEYWQAYRDAIAAGTAKKGSKEKKGDKKGTYVTWSIDATVYRIPNSDTTDQVNTCQKMSQKRSLIAAVLVATNASEFMTQDLEDLATPIDVTFTQNGVDIPTETKEQVTARRIAEETAKAEAAKKEQQPAQEDPEELKALVGGCAKREGIQEVFNKLGDRAEAMLGLEQATVLFNELLKRQGLANVNAVYASVVKAREMTRAWYRELEAVKARKAKADTPAATEPAKEAAAAEDKAKITDADLPGELFPKGTEGYDGKQ